MRTLSDTLEQTPDDLRAAVDGVAKLSDTVNSRDESIRQLLTNAERTTAVLTERSGQINLLILDANSILGELDSRRLAVETLFANTAALSASGQQIVSFNNRMSTVTDVLADNKAHLVTVQIPNRSMRYGTGSFGSMTNESSSRRLVSYCAAHETNLPVIIS